VAIAPTLPDTPDSQSVAETRRIVNMTIPQDDWSELGELAVRRQG
jgi:hypothetical protein